MHDDVQKFRVSFPELQCNFTIVFRPSIQLKYFFMIEIINGLPPTVAAFRATGKITEDDYLKIINPLVDKIYKEFGKINYLLVINTSLSNYSIGAWIRDALLGFVYFTDWNKIVIVTEKKSIKDFTDFFGKLVPGKTKGFMMEDLGLAKQWVSE